MDMPQHIQPCSIDGIQVASFFALNVYIYVHTNQLFYFCRINLFKDLKMQKIITLDNNKKGLYSFRPWDRAPQKKNIKKNV